MLDALQKPHFEPLKQSDLKFVTYKTIFRVAITTFRRCSDLQALRLGEEAVKVQNRGVTFIRTGLSKQDRPGHVRNKIFVLAFKDNKKLDPKRAFLSSNLPGSQSPCTYVAVPLSDHSNSTTVAQETLVHKPVTKSNRLSKKITSSKQSSSSTLNKNISSQSRNVQFDSMAALNQNFRNSEFSAETRKLLTASWRAGTQQDYACKFKKFNSWCCERQKGPYSASLVDCADFLNHLFKSGLQYRTIAGYRSMLSSVLLPIDNIPVGQHPYIIRLLKGSSIPDLLL